MKKEKIKKTLECRLTREELEKKSHLLAKQSIEAENLELQRKSVLSDFKAKSDLLKKEISILSGEIASKSEYREVECEVFYNEPKKEEKTIIRMDTGEVEAIEIMSIAEKEDLFKNN